MRWIIWPLRVLAILFFACAPVAPVFAGTVADVNLFATPLYGSGILSFTITYVSDTQLDLSWTVGANVTNVMVRSSYGKYPNDITSANQTPSDGSLVYYGPLLAFSDTSMDFENNFGMRLYYRAWAQRPDGTWFVNSKSGWKESSIMTLLAVIAIAGILSFLGFKNVQMRFIGGIAWFFVLVYWLSNRPSAITAGTPPDVFAILLFIAAGVIMFFWPTLTSRLNGQERGAGFRFNTDRIFGREERGPRVNAREAYRNRAANYAGRVNRALGREE